MAIAATLRNYGDVTLTDQLQEALNSRSIIDRAIGIIVATQHISPVEAFTALRKQSQNGNTRLATIARQLVDGYTQAD
ncbi:ANTAR domain-containing protein [Nakamurella sp. A5-74]|uniref:ANTAR domain-containing protein n=1 Tax=Nakamurella sp. A5-74 TaxID=3158264 RepID=A0AAU8DLS4_9ACTN